MFREKKSHLLKIWNIITSILLLLPFVFVGAKVLYTQLNENAKDSYSYNITYVNATGLQVGNDYMFDSYNLPLENYDSGDVFISNIYDITTSNDNLHNELFSGTVTSFHLYASSTNKVLFLYPSANSYTLLTNTLSFNFTLDGFSPNKEAVLLNVIYDIYSNTLDNAFEYGLSEFNDIGFNKIDFVGFIDDIFINSNSLNNVYLTFINCYFNYMLFALFVSFIPFVFWWLYYFITNVLMRYMDKH